MYVAAQYLPLQETQTLFLKTQPTMISYKPFLLAALIITCCAAAHGQTLTGMKIMVTRTGETLSSFSFRAGDITFCIDGRGYLEYQLETGSNKTLELDYYNNFHDWEAGKLKSVNNMGIEYYDAFNSLFTGRLKRLGNVEITYYDQFHAEKSGKIKSAGNVQLDYYDNFHAERAGKLKSVSNLNLEYYDGFNTSKNGKLKSAGTMQLDYYDNFYPEKSGRLKSVSGSLPNVAVIMEQ